MKMKKRGLSKRRSESRRRRREQKDFPSVPVEAAHTTRDTSTRLGCNYSAAVDISGTKAAHERHCQAAARHAECKLQEKNTEKKSTGRAGEKGGLWTE